MITRLVIDLAATNDQGEQLLLQLRNVEQLDLAGIQFRLQCVIEHRLCKTITPSLIDSIGAPEQAR